MEYNNQYENNRAINYFFFFYCYSSTVVSIFSPYACPPRPTHPHLLPSNLPTLALSMCLYVFLDGTSLIIPYYPSPPSSLVTVSLLFISVSLIVFCLLVCFVDQVLEDSYSLCQNEALKCVGFGNLGTSNLQTAF